jgi:two-component system response regulator FixJ
MDRKVYIIEDDQDFSTYLEQVLSRMGLEGTSFSNAEDFLAHIQPEHRGCIVADIRLPGMSGLAMLAEVRKKHVELPYIILSGYATVKKTVTAMQDGAYTLIEKPIDEQEFGDAVHAALTQEGQIFKLQEQELGYIGCYEKLSKGEKDVFRCIVRGMPNKNIASDLRVSLRTIESRRRKVFQKMKAESVAELVALAISARHRIPIDIRDMPI